MQCITVQRVCAKPGMIRLVTDWVIGTGQSIGLLGLVSKQLTTCSTTACPSFFRRRVALPSPLAKSSSSFCAFWSRTATVVALAVRLGAMASWEEGVGESNGGSLQTLCVPTPSHHTIPPHHPTTPSHHTIPPHHPTTPSVYSHLLSLSSITNY